MTSQERSIELLKLLRDHGYGIEDLISFLEQLGSRRSPHDKPLEVRVANHLRTLAIPPSINGYDYLKTAVILAYKHPELKQQIFNRLYPMVAENHGTTAARAERCIRHAIEVSFSRMDMDIMDMYFANTFSIRKGKTTNGEFIGTLAEILKMEDMEAAE